MTLPISLLFIRGKTVKPKGDSGLCINGKRCVFIPPIINDDEAL